MSLNQAQERAVRAADGPVMVLAGPGSGKTTVITHRIRYLIEKRKVDPSRILVITFTRAAAEEMKERFGRMMGGVSLPVTFGTFHSVFFRILRLAYRYSTENIVKPEQRNRMIRDALRQAEGEVEDEAELLAQVAAEISVVKGDLIDPENYYSKNLPQEVFRRVYRSYEKQLRGLGLIDFDDMLGLCDQLLRERADILKAWQGKYQYILIDEFQDINRLQYEIIRRLALPENNLFIVGDDDQSIYRFRGARPEIMLGFPKDYPETVQILLDVNYRSVPAVVAASGRLIVRNEHRFAKEIRANRSAGLTVETHEYRDLPEENDDVIRRLSEYHRQGTPYEQMALLYRTNAGPRAMAEQLMRLNMPFQMTDVVPNLYDHWITGDILTYLRLAAGSDTRSDFLRIINRPKRYIPRDAFPDPTVSMEALRARFADREWMEERIDRLEYDLRMLRKMRPWAAVNYIRRGIGYEEFLKEYAEMKHVPADDLLRLMDEVQESARPFASLGEWQEHMAEYSRELARQRMAKRAEKNGIPILTMHGAKGLEFSIVFVMDANEGTTPHHKAVLPEDIEEERRLFYVAMTRAKSKLHLCYVRERFNRKLEPSRFVGEAVDLAKES